MEIFEAEEKREFETVLPLVNIVFLLLIFFMLAGAFTKPDLFEVTMPEANLNNDADFDHMSIVMNENKEFAIEKKQFSSEELVEYLTVVVSNDDSLIVQLKADQNVKSQDLIDTLEALSDSGLKSIRLLTVVGSDQQDASEASDNQ